MKFILRDAYNAEDYEFDTLAEVYKEVADHYKSFEEDKEDGWVLADEDFDFESYEVYQRLDVDLKKTLTTNSRGTFPKTYAVEGTNFID